MARVQQVIGGKRKAKSFSKLGDIFNNRNNKQTAINLQTTIVFLPTMDQYLKFSTCNSYHIVNMHFNIA